MMALDALNNLKQWPLLGLDKFITKCLEYNVTEINLTGTNTEPLLFEHHKKLADTLRERIPDVILGLRTNGALVLNKPHIWNLYDKASITLPSFDQDIYTKQMGKGRVPNIKKILEIKGPQEIKINIVLGPENYTDITNTLEKLSGLGVKKVNLREPYGQPHVGDPLVDIKERAGEILGMPQYNWNGMRVTYWDVHYVHVESVNLYAQGKVSLTYPITKGHDDKTGTVMDQSHWKQTGRHNKQWIN